MPQSLSNVLIHIVFSTKNRKPYLAKEIRDELYRYIYSLCKKHKTLVKKIGGTSDHIHILVELSRSVTISDLVKEIKSNSSRWLKTKKEINNNFSWQSGYGAFSIGKSGFDNCVRYIKNQAQHHKHATFKEEMLLLLKKYRMNYDEKYLWD